MAFILRQESRLRASMARRHCVQSCTSGASPDIAWDSPDGQERGIESARSRCSCLARPVRWFASCRVCGVSSVPSPPRRRSRPPLHVTPRQQEMVLSVCAWRRTQKCQNRRLRTGRRWRARTMRRGHGLDRRDACGRCLLRLPAAHTAGSRYHCTSQAEHVRVARRGGSSYNA